MYTRNGYGVGVTSRGEKEKEDTESAELEGSGRCRGDEVVQYGDRAWVCGSPAQFRTEHLAKSIVAVPV